MIQFWLDNPMDLLRINLSFDSNVSQNYIKILNLIALVTIVVNIFLTIKYKKTVYFAVTVVILSLTILIKSNINYSAFTQTATSNKQPPAVTSNAYTASAHLTRAFNLVPGALNNRIYVNTVLNFNVGDIIGIGNVNGQIFETNIVQDTLVNEENSIIVLQNPLKNNYSKYTTKVYKVNDAYPSIILPPDGNRSIQNAGFGTSDYQTMAVQNFPKPTVKNGDRHDWNLENATMVNGVPNTYRYQGQPYGDLKCRNSSVENPMGTINVTEYDQAPTMFGTCNEGELNPNGKLNNTVMTENQEATVSQRVNDLLFHRENAQSRFSPTSVDTIPNDQEGFANWCYRSPTNLVNPKYGSIFVNDPDKMLLVMKLSKATGTENGGG
jgi:hypothetical protein